MTIKSCFNDKQANGGFSLLEMTIVLIIITVLASAVIPQFVRGYTVSAANKVALDISAIEEASRAYYIANDAWPASVAVLQTGNYLPPAWNGINPFGYSSATPSTYVYSISSTNNLLTVSTNVPVAAQPIIQNLLPVVSVSGSTIYSSVSLPGSLSVLPPGTIAAEASNSLPAGYLWCNGQAVSRTTYSALFTAIGTIYGVGDGSTTFNIPNLMARTIVGTDGMGGASPTNLITLWGTSPTTLGGTFGESAHTLATAEIPQLAIQYEQTAAHWGASSDVWTIADQVWENPSNKGHSYGYLYTQNPNSGGLASAHNVVQPSMTLSYIIKF